jgi:tetratricopeptide (TPR) repeat protein
MPSARLLCLAAALGLLSGCGGDPDLLQRFRAERLLWKARRLAAIEASGVTDPGGLLAWQTAAALDRVVRAFPPGRWATEDAMRRPRARDVATLSGTAALLRANEDERAGHDAAAERQYSTIAAAYAVVDSVCVAAQASRARCLERMGRNERAASIWLDLAWRAAELDSAGVAPWSVRLVATTEAVRLLRHIGREAEADSVRERSAARIGAAAARIEGTPIADDLWDTVARLMRQAGRFDAAREALRAALRQPGSSGPRAARLLQLASVAREARLPDTARVYATWAGQEFPGPVAGEATLTLAHAWEDAGVADSALAVYKRLIEGLPSMGDLAARARLDRARLLDRMEHWEAARAELRALAMMQPTHPCGQAALVEIVRHHVREREAVFAAVEAKHAMTTFDQMLATQRDPSVRLEIMASRAEVLELMGRREEALREYSAAWRENVRLPAASLAGWRAARLADSALSDPRSAQALYRELAVRSTDLEVRWQARVRMQDADRPGSAR